MIFFSVSRMIGYFKPIVRFSYFFSFFYAINNDDNNDDVDARMICERKVRPNDVTAVKRTKHETNLIYTNVYEDCIYRTVSSATQEKIENE